VSEDGADVKLEGGVTMTDGRATTGGGQWKVSTLPDIVNALVRDLELRLRRV
jgi:hypothetical protein